MSAWYYQTFGGVLSHECGLSSCLPESEFLAEEIQVNCDGTQAHKVTLVLDGGNIDDGTFNQAAYEGGLAACNSDIDCCLEVDRVDEDANDPSDEERFFCELEYAASDSDMTIGVGFLHELSVHRAATCVPQGNFAIVDVAYATDATLPNLEGMQFEEDQAGYLAGVVAGGVSATKKLGVIGGLEIALCERLHQRRRVRVRRLHRHGHLLPVWRRGRAHNGDGVPPRVC